ncbi:MAG: LuxR C-terminal-related transcriptional regulator [Bifidobacteriaceae bacterium]|jgi:hypothetical protein|nr:LuxR C-terminal-related transcriptional regulator [Bifidobacteriaceae bacterium]
MPTATTKPGPTELDAEVGSIGDVAATVRAELCARMMQLRPETVKKSLGRIMDKLQVHNRVQATARMLCEGLAH